MGTIIFSGKTSDIKNGIALILSEVGTSITVLDYISYMKSVKEGNNANHIYLEEKTKRRGITAVHKMPSKNNIFIKEDVVRTLILSRTEAS